MESYWTSQMSSSVHVLPRLTDPSNVLWTCFIIYFLFLSDEGPMLETLDYTIRIGSTPTFLYFDSYLYTLPIRSTLYVHLNIIRAEKNWQFSSSRNFDKSSPMGNMTFKPPTMLPYRHILLAGLLRKEGRKWKKLSVVSNHRRERNPKGKEN